MKFNWRRGFLRVWILGSVGWAAILACADNPLPRLKAQTYEFESPSGDKFTVAASSRGEARQGLIRWITQKYAGGPVTVARFLSVRIDGVGTVQIPASVVGKPLKEQQAIVSKIAADQYPGVRRSEPLSWRFEPPLWLSDPSAGPQNPLDNKSGLPPDQYIAKLADERRKAAAIADDTMVQTLTNEIGVQAGRAADNLVTYVDFPPPPVEVVTQFTENLMIPPLIVLCLGWALGWAAAGFRPR